MAPTSYARGGVGEFRDIMPAALLGDASTMTGLPGAARTLACLGPAAPAPDWRAYLGDPGAVPEACAGGAPDAALADTAPAVRLVARDFGAARSWRANLSYASRVRWLAYGVEGTYSLNLDQRGQTDLNLRASPAFATADERRPVFAPAAAIVPATGAVSLAQSRAAPGFGQVLLTHSGLRSVSRQAIVTVAPDLSTVSDWWVQASYVLARSRALRGGFDATAFDSPLAREWQRAPLDARHQLVLRGGYVAGPIAFSLFGRLASGLPFTPVVGSDVNGDGFANDRAFVPDAAADPALARQLDALLAAAPAARRCLGGQRGRAAAGGSCEAPWTAALNAQVTLDGRLHRLGKRVSTVRLNLANPLAGLDQLLHGANGLRGWGAQPAPDPTLLFVRGFDPAARRFRYEVNPRFAGTAPARSLVRAPFRVTLDVRINLTPDVAQQQLARYLGPGRAGRPGARLTVPELKQRYERNVGDPYAAVLQLTDSLLLSRAQVEALQQAQARYRRTMDSVWLDLATEFAALGDRYDVAAAVRGRSARSPRRASSPASPSAPRWATS
jgi:hypothetical protein